MIQPSSAKLLVLILSIFALSPSASADPPNVVFFLVDDMGWRDVACMGSDYHQTPHIDGLFESGMKFTQAYANAANCAPSRAALLSGMYAPRTGVYTVNPINRGKAQHRRWIPHPNNAVLSAEVETLAERFKSVGYHTATIGKFHVGEVDTPSDPENQGFDLNIGGYKSGHPKSYFSPYKNPRLTDGPKGEYLTDRLTIEAVDYIQQKREGSFFLYLPYYTVHTPMQPRKDLLQLTSSRPKGKLHDRADFAAMVEALDESIGKVLAALDDAGVADNTIVVFSSDNGGHGAITNMDPLRGSKGMLYEGGIRVPLAVRWPGVVKPGSTSETPVLLFDFYPTLCEAVGAELPKSQPVDGVSLMPILRGENHELKDRALFWHFPGYLQKYSGMNGRWRATPASVVRQGPWKLIEQYETDTIELYHLEDDISESRNLAQAKPEIAHRLLKTLREWQQMTDAPTDFEPNPKYKPN